MSIWLSWVQGLLISPSQLFFHFKNIPLHSSSSLFLSGTESKCGFNEVLMPFFFFVSVFQQAWIIGIHYHFSVCFLPGI